MSQEPGPASATILIVDDDLPVRRLLQRLLETEGYTVITADRGGTAWELLQEKLPDLAVFDILMPDMNGVELCARVQTLPLGEFVPIIMSTSLDDQKSIDAAFAAGAADYIPKPVHWPVLRQRVRRLLRAKGAEESQRHYAAELEHGNRKLQGLYEKVSALEQLKSDMLRLASHDLRSPLSLIVGYLEMLRLDLWDTFTADTQFIFVEMEQASERMRRIVDDILSVERVQEGRDERKITVDLRELVQAAFRDECKLAERKTQTFTLEAPDTPLYVRADTALMYEAIINLLNNAIKYTPDGGEIRVRLNTANDIVSFEVEDTGYGIPENLQTWLFQPFFRAKSDATSHIEGTGLGLHLVKNIIERHEGILHFHSEYGRGSTFGFQIPLKGSG